MKTFLITTLLACGLTAANAQSAGAIAVSGSNSQAGAASTSLAQGGDSRASAVNGAATTGNAQNITFNTAAPNAHTTQDINGTQTIRTVATVYAPSIGVSAPCLIAASGGVTGLGFGVALGTNLEDAGCTLRETSRLLFSIGQTQAAAKVMCANVQAAVALGEAIYPNVKTLVAVTVATKVYEQCHSDPIVAKRINLPVCPTPQ